MEKSMNKQRALRLDRKAKEPSMEAELFIPPVSSQVRRVIAKEIPKHHEDWAQEPASGLALINAFVHSVRFESVLRGCRYNKSMRRRILSGLKHYDHIPGAAECIAELMFEEGATSARVRDYESALEFYEMSQVYQTDNEGVRYFRLNNLGFTLLYFCRFEEAESFLRQAIEVNPDRHHAWKNLGISLEHQCQYEEAAQCYLRSTQLAGGDERPVMHLSRLIARHPILHQVPAIVSIIQSNEEPLSS